MYPGDEGGRGRRGRGRAEGGGQRPGGGRAHREGLAPQHHKVVGTLHEEAGELVRDDTVHLVYLLDLHANPALRRRANKAERAAAMAAKGAARPTSQGKLSGHERVCGMRACGGWRAELTAGSIVVYSISDRRIVIGCRISSGDVLRHRRGGELGFRAIRGDRGRGRGQNRSAHPTSISGLLCRSTICEAKFCRHSAAFSDSLTASR